jgi:hypothetical protein
LWFLIGSGGLVVTCCLIMAFAGWLFFRRTEPLVTASLAVVDAFLVAGAQNDVDAALQLVDAESTVTKDQVTALFTNRSDAFAGYRAVQQTSFYIRSGTIGTFMDLEGVVQYTDQPERRFSATLRGTNDNWKIVRFRFNDGIE